MKIKPYQQMSECKFKTVFLHSKVEEEEFNLDNWRSSRAYSDLQQVEVVGDDIFFRGLELMVEEIISKKLSNIENCLYWLTHKPVLYKDTVNYWKSVFRWVVLEELLSYFG